VTPLKIDFTIDVGFSWSPDRSSFSVCAGFSVGSFCGMSVMLCLLGIIFLIISRTNV
jgi:hypothetical protein